MRISSAVSCSSSISGSLQSNSGREAGTGRGRDSTWPIPPDHRALLSWNPQPHFTPIWLPVDVGCKQDRQSSLSPGHSLPQRLWPWPRTCLPARAALVFLDRAPTPTRGRQTAGQGPQTQGATWSPYAWSVCSVSSRPSLQTQDRKITPGRSPEPPASPPHPTRELALTCLRRRRPPRAQ